MNFTDSFGVVYMQYNKYVKNCEKKGETPEGFLKYICKCFH